MKTECRVVRYRNAEGQDQLGLFWIEFSGVEPVRVVPEHLDGFNSIQDMTIVLRLLRRALQQPVIDARSFDATPAAGSGTISRLCPK